ncbi:hypothetical protein ACP26C_01775 [Franconibacter helveticus 513]|nr:hypothetical protein [Franconibacter helveticus]
MKAVPGGQVVYGRPELAPVTTPGRRQNAQAATACFPAAPHPHPRQ